MWFENNCLHELCFQNFGIQLRKNHFGLLYLEDFIFFNSEKYILKVFENQLSRNFLQQLL